MPLEPGLIGYAALASLSLVQKKHRHAPMQSLIPTPRTAYMAGIALLLLSLMLAMLRSGGGLGVVGWIGQLCVAGTILVLLMSWRPRVALLLALGALGAGLALSVVA